YHRIIVPLGNWFRGLTSTTYYVSADDGDNGEDFDHSDHPFVDEDNFSTDSAETNSSGESKTASSYQIALRHLNRSIGAARECVDAISRANEPLPQEYDRGALNQALQKQKTVRDKLRAIRNEVVETDAQTHNNQTMFQQ
ncbi:MAG: hypothetical protein KAS93_01175, partial [Gammaproteobacteria bacterium]|nr:hypothetical protein [Gammaproteobacteria bacterium]